MSMRPAMKNTIEDEEGAKKHSKVLQGGQHWFSTNPVGTGNGKVENKSKEAYDDEKQDDANDAPVGVRRQNPPADLGVGESKRVVGSKTFPLFQAGQVQVKQPNWLLQDYMEEDSLVLIFGEPGCGKSFFAIDVACSVATGTKFHGLPVKQAPVIYIAGEGHNGLSRRWKAWSIKNDVDLADADLFFSNRPTSICDSSEFKELKESIQQVATQIGNPGLIVIDTLARNFGPGDENATKDMSHFVNALTEIRAKYKCTILVIHHTGHNNKGRERGSYSLSCALDANYRLEKNDSGVIRLDSIKMKEFDDPKSLAFKICKVDLGMKDHNGKEITSAALYKTEDVQDSKQRFSGKKQTAYDILKKLYEENLEILEGNNSDKEDPRITMNEWSQAVEHTNEISKKYFSQLKKELKQDQEVLSMLYD